MAEVSLHVTDVSGLEILRHHLRPGVEHRHRRLSGDVILPFIRIRVPMHFAQAAGVYGDQGRGDGLRRLEIAAVGDARLAAGGLAGGRHAGELEA
jgi:hypothetical protein